MHEKDLSSAIDGAFFSLAALSKDWPAHEAEFNQVILRLEERGVPQDVIARLVMVTEQNSTYRGILRALLDNPIQPGETRLQHSRRVFGTDAVFNMESQMGE